MIQQTTTRYPNILIRASAGTGKTFQLSNRFLELLDQDVALDQILATIIAEADAANAGVAIGCIFPRAPGSFCFCIPIEM